MSRKKILLADDVELFLMLEKTVYNRNEFELITARSGRDILKHIKEEEPAIVFLNLFMPDMNGDECCRTVKEDAMGQQIPVIMVVPVNMEKDLEKCRLSGCDDILRKPITRKEFLATTRKYLHIKERGDQRFKARLRIKYSAESLGSHDNYCIDINSGGLFLETENPLIIDTPLDLEFQLPSVGSVIRCKARGAWVNDPRERKKPNLPAGMGVQFLDISPADMYAIDEFIGKSGSSQVYSC